jgi:hypothetical protein
MKIVIEYKGTTRSKFTFTEEEIRIKIADQDMLHEQYFIDVVSSIYNLLLETDWDKQTLRCRLSQPLTQKSFPLKSHDGKLLATAYADKIIWNITNKEEK